MEKFSINKLTKPFDCVIDKIASDKSISHRCAMFSILSDQTSHVRNFLMAEDTLNTLKIVGKLGAEIKIDGANVTINPPAIPQEPDDVLDCGNSGTGMRLFCGLLSSINGAFVLSGDKYLRSRPMKRVLAPLREIGAKVDGRKNGDLAPLFIRGGSLKAFTYHSAIDSAQIKSAMILAGLKADGVCKYKENALSRDHTERMLKGMGVEIFTDSEGWINLTPINGPLKPLDITVPSDPSSSFFFGLAAAIVPGAKITLKNVTLNPTRIEAFKVLQKMGASVEFVEKENIYEPLGDIIVSHKELNGVEVSENIAWLIDELPALSIAMSLAKGKSIVRNAKELRVKESDRISAVINNLKLCGVKCSEFEDGYEIEGGTLNKATIDSHGDHRIAMSFSIAGLVCGMEIQDVECINTSFPNFKELHDGLYE